VPDPVKDRQDTERLIEASKDLRHQLRTLRANLMCALDAAGEPGRIADERRFRDEEEFEVRVAERVEQLKSEVMNNLRATQKMLEAKLAEGPILLNANGFTNAISDEERADKYRESIVAYWNPLKGDRGEFEPDKLIYAAAIAAYCKQQALDSPFGKTPKFVVEGEALDELAVLRLREMAVEELLTGKPADPLPMPVVHFKEVYR
jgi:hypothetical protein